MAGDWLPMRLDLDTDPAVISMASALGTTEIAIVGGLFRVWSWANRHTANGHARGVTEMFIDRHVGVSGFAAAMISAGWLESNSDGLRLPKFDEWNSKGAKARLSAAKRKGKSRSQTDAPVTEMSRSQRDKSVTREEKRREEKKNTSAAAKPPTAGESEPVPKSLAVVEPEKPRPRNELFDAIAEVCGVDPKTSGSSIGKAAATIAKASPAYTPDDVREFGRRYAELCSWAKGYPTPSELEKYIGRIRAPTKHVRPHTRGAAQDDYAMGLLFNSAKGGDGVATEVDF